MLRWFRWSRSPNYEQELPRLSEQIKQIRSRALAAHSQQRRWPFLFLLQALAVYITYVASTIRMSLHLHPKHMAALALSPFFIYLVNRGIYRFATWRKNRLDTLLNDLTSKRKNLVEDYKKKTNFYEIQRLIDEDSSDLPQQQTTQKRRDTANASVASALKPDHGVGLDNNITKQLDQAQTHAQTHGVPTQKQSSTDVSLPDFSTARVSQEPTPVYHTSWVDRVLDLLIGENEQGPANRYALICAHCQAHNGLAPYGKSAEEVYYKCPVCGSQNGSPDSKLDAVKLEQSSSVSSLPESIGEPSQTKSEDQPEKYVEPIKEQKKEQESFSSSTTGSSTPSSATNLTEEK